MFYIFFVCTFLFNILTKYYKKYKIIKKHESGDLPMQKKSILAELMGESDKLEYVRSGLLCEVFSNMPSLHDIMLLSSQYYERQEIQARMAFVVSDSEIPTITENGVTTLALNPQYTNEVRLEPDNIRQITKFLASTDKSHPLIMKLNSETDTAYNAIGISTVEVPLNKVTFSVQFNGHMNYSFFVGDNHYFDFKNGMYKVPKDNIGKLSDALREMGIIDENIQIFKSHIEALIENGHGTTLVFCACPHFYQQESERLINAKRGIKINPINLFDEKESVDIFLKQTAVADGGFLVNIDGNCEVINVIFDGEVKIEWDNKFRGETARGSRFNSLKTYVFGKNFKCIYCDICKKRTKNCKNNLLRVLSIIISDDGMVDVIC